MLGQPLPATQRGQRRLGDLGRRGVFGQLQSAGRIMTRSAEQPIQLGDVPLGYLQHVRPELVEQPHLLESVCAGGDLLSGRAQSVRVGAATGAQDRLQRGERGMRLENLAALGELPQQHRPQPVQTAAAGQFSGQFGGRMHRGLANQFHAQPHAEQTRTGRAGVGARVRSPARCWAARRIDRRSAAARRPLRSARWPARPGRDTPVPAGSPRRAPAGRPPARSPGTAAAAAVRTGSADPPVRRRRVRPAGTTRSRRRGTARRPRSSGCRAPRSSSWNDSRNRTSLAWVCRSR